MKKTWIICLCVLLLAGMASLAHAEDAKEVKYAPWLSYVLTVEWVEDNAELPGADMPGGQKAAEGFRLVKVHFGSAGDPIATTDIETSLEQFVVRDDGDQTEYPPASYQLQGVSLDVAKGTFSTDETQAAFDLIFELPEATEMDALTLLVATDKPDERIMVRLGSVPAGPVE